MNSGGSIDGKHIRISHPPSIRVKFYNYKGFYSLIWMVVVNSNCDYIYIDIENNKRLSDRSVLEYIKIYQSLKGVKL